MDKKGRIYKIFNVKTDDIYIGSTIQTLKDRFKAHKSNAKLNKNGLLYDCMRDIGIDAFSIELIEEIDISNKKQLLSKNIHADIRALKIKKFLYFPFV